MGRLGLLQCKRYLRIVNHSMGSELSTCRESQNSLHGEAISRVAGSRPANEKYVGYTTVWWFSSFHKKFCNPSISILSYLLIVSQSTVSSLPFISLPPPLNRLPSPLDLSPPPPTRRSPLPPSWVQKHYFGSGRRSGKIFSSRILGLFTFRAGVVRTLLDLICRS
jgi:hypothetical protein